MCNNCLKYRKSAHDNRSAYLTNSKGTTACLGQTMNAQGAVLKLN